MRSRIRPVPTDPAAPAPTSGTVRRIGAGVLAVGAAVALAGCGAGQISQTAMQQAAVDGTNANVGDPATGVALRNIHLRAPQPGAAVAPGSQAELLFLASNESADQPDRLISITSDIGPVALLGDISLAPSATLVVGTPDGQPSPLSAAEAAGTAEATVMLSQPISNGLTYPFTFTFQRSGQVTVSVPISAGESPRRDAQATTP